MANYFYLTLDTTGPSSPSITIEGGSAYVSNQIVNTSISTGDGDTTGYQMKIWGDVDGTYDTDIQSTEGASNWITFSASQQLKLSSGDGAKTIYLRIRDDVHNQSAQASDGTTLDTTLPVVTISGPDVSKISKQPTKNVSSFSFTVNEVFDEFKVKVVGSTGASHDTGTLIGTANGSTNTSGSAGGYDTTANGAENVSINGADLETASAGDGQKIIKVFVKDQAGTWSV